MSVSPNFTTVPTYGFSPRANTPFTENLFVNMVADTILGATNYSWAVVHSVTGAAAPNTPVVGQSVTVEFSTAGPYNVTLTVTLADTTTVSIGKNAWIHVSDWGTNLGDYDWWPMTTHDPIDWNVGPAPFTLVFTGIVNPFPYPQYPHTYYLWNFGDGTQLALVDDPTCSHTYTTPGTYPVVNVGTTSLTPIRCLGGCSSPGAWQLQSGATGKGSIVVT